MRAAFLKKLSECGQIGASAAAAGIGLATVGDWRRDDKQFADDVEAALELGTVALEDTAHRLALDGNEKLLMFLLTARNPEKYRTRASMDVTSNITLSLRAMSEDRLNERLQQLRAEIGGSGNPRSLEVARLAAPVRGKLVDVSEE